MVFGEVYRRGCEWKLRAVGQGFAGGLGPLARNYGVDVSTGGSAPPPSESPSPPPNPPEPARQEVTEEPPKMPRGPLTYTGRYPGYEPAQAMEAFFSASGQHDRPAYAVRRDGWVFDGGGYWIVVGCFVEPDGTPVIALTLVSEARVNPPQEVFLGEFFNVIQPSAHSTHVVLGDEEITESGESGTLRQLRPNDIHSDTPNHVKDFIFAALNHVYPGLWKEFDTDAAAFVSEGEGVIVTYNGNRFQVATIVLTDLQISTELLEGIREVNVGLPIGNVFLSDAETGWCAIWKYKLLGDWLGLDTSSQVSGRMVGDILINAPNMTQIAREILQAKKCGGSSAHPVDPESPYAIFTASHV